MAPNMDIGWEHATALEGDKRRPKCNYCGKTLSGGITRLKEHLAHHSGNVAGCTKVSKELMLLMQQNIAAGKSEKEISRRKKDEVMQRLQDDVAYGYGRSDYHDEMLSEDVDDYHRRHSVSHVGGETSSSSQFHGGSRVPLRSQSQRAPIDRRSTEEEIRRADPYAFSSFLEQIHMSSRNKHPIVNFMVHCNGDMIFHKSFDTTGKKKTADFIYGLMKDVVKEIGEKNVVHIVTDNEASYKAAGKKLMNRYKHLFWSPCAAHCIDLILEDIGNINTVRAVVHNARKITSFIYNSDQLVNCMREYTGGRELLRPGITRFATEFVALESLLRYKQELRRLFTSDEWRELSYVKNKTKVKLAKEVCQLVLGENFWKKASEVQIAMEPLVLVLKLVDQEKKPTMSVIYDAMDRAKNGIKMSKVKDWKQYWDIIDSRWERTLHCSLHAAGYFLNPMCQYGDNFVYDEEVRLGLKEVIKRLEPNVENQAKALMEAQIFREREGSFGTTLAQTSVKFQLPAEWWFHHGETAPNLRKVALKVLSQTCSSSGCERNWSTFALIHTQIRNRLAMKKLEQLVFVHYNLRLRVRRLSKKHSDDNEYCPINLNNMFNDQDSLDPWITEVEEPLLDDQDTSWLDAGLTVHATEKGARQLSANANVVVSSSSTSGEGGNSYNDGNNSGSGGGDHNEGYDNQNSGRETGHSWQEGNTNYFATQDTDHGYRHGDPSSGISERRKHLRHLQDIPSQSPSDQHENLRGFSYPSGLYEMPQQFNYRYPPYTTNDNYTRGQSFRASSSQDQGSSNNYSSFGINISDTPTTPSAGMEISSCDGESSQSNMPMFRPFPLPHEQFTFSAQEEPIEPHRHSVWW